MMKLLLIFFVLLMMSLHVRADVEPARRVELGFSQGSYSNSSKASETALRVRAPLREGIDVGFDFSQREVFGEKGMLLSPFAALAFGERWIFQGGGIVSDSSPVYPVSQISAQAGYKWLDSREIITFVGAGKTNYQESAYEEFILGEVVWYSPWGLILQAGNRFVKSEPLGDSYGRLYAVATYQLQKGSVSVRHDRGREAYEIVAVDRTRFNFESSSTSLQARLILPENLIGIAGFEDYQSEGLNRQTWSLGVGVGF
ncbi:YaiO family outer membrane beta-barrel protein [Bdellovibrio sp. HCB2-146]|uniref:YaiO family outer membrane beta-barrel protein n=1 Tax=Bdellovibrio sp. HCB2-146 TaxID=3394362 RepID=UPI0039BD0649